MRGSLNALEKERSGSVRSVKLNMMKALQGFTAAIITAGVIIVLVLILIMPLRFASTIINNSPQTPTIIHDGSSPVSDSDAMRYC